MKSRLQITAIALLLFTMSFSQTVDTSFGTNGIVVNEFTQAVDALNTMILQPDGKIVALGFVNNSIALARYQENGSLDVSFGNEGVVITDFDSYGFLAPLDVAVQPDGKIVIMGRDYDINLLARYNTNGTIDTSFGSNGIVNLNTMVGSGSGQFCTSMKLLDNGKIVVTGDVQSLQKIFIIRYSTTGEPDTAFGTNGYTITDTPVNYTALSAEDFCIQPDGHILIAASCNKISGYPAFSFIRYSANGILDTGFGTNGFIITDIGGADSNDTPTAIKLQPDGKILLAGTSGSNFAVVRYNINGTLDTAFNSTGIVTTVVGGPYRTCADMLIEPDGKIVIAGSIGDDFACVRYTTNGMPDSDFGINGIFKMDFGGSYDYGNVIVRQSDNKFVMGGWTSLFCTDRGFGLTRFSSPAAALDNEEYLSQNDIVCYPNPTNGQFNITLPEAVSESQVIIWNSLGQQISNEKFYFIDRIDLSIEGVQGIYFVEVLQSGKTKTFLKVVKN